MMRSRKNIYITRAIKVTCFLLAVLVTTAVLQQYVLCHYDHNRLRMDGFYLEDENSLDVVFIGASEVYAGVAPGLAYEKYGFTSYVCATSSATAAATKTQVQEAIRTQNPKLMVVEINSFLYGNGNESKESSIRKYVDNIPLNANKIENISENVATEDQLEYYVPIIKYHGAWNDYPEPARRMITMLKQDMRGYTYLKGFKTYTKRYNPKKTTKILNDTLADNDERMDLDSVLDQKLRDFLDYCKAENIDNILFIRMPHEVRKSSYSRFKRGNTAGDIIKSYGYDYLNFERDPETLAYTNTDYYNYDHLNIYGAQKFTEYLGKIITEDYGVGKSDLTSEQEERWNTAAEYYNKFYRYCDDLIMNTNQKSSVEEDINTLAALEKY